MKLIIDIPDKEWEEWKNGLGIIHTKPLTEALEKAKPLQEEIEEIKADIDEIVENEMEENKYWSLGLRHSKKIIDNHIKELKGESNE